LIFLFPLVILALGYNLISAEREQGTLPLALSQPLTLSQLVTGKIVLRGLVLLGLLTVFTLGGAALTGVHFASADAWLRLGLWLALMSLYTAFWFGLAVLVNTWRASSATNALTLAGCWLAFALVLPSLANLVATSLYPVPSRVEMVQAMRVAGKEAQSKGSVLLSKYMEDHPELVPGETAKGAPDFASLTYAVQMEVDRQVQPVLDRFDAQVSSQQAFVDGFRFFSPAILVQDALNNLAGASLGRYRHFTGQVDRFFSQWQAYFLPKVFAKTKLTSAQVASLPRYEWIEESTATVAARVLIALLGLFVLNAAVLILAYRRLPRVSPAG
jgi:ABC-2 type transport system permease protein